MVVVAVVLLYATAMLVSRQGDEHTRMRSGFMALRGAPAEGSSPARAAGDRTLEREEVEKWDPPTPNYNYAERGPVKGGVEVYPLQV